MTARADAAPFRVKAVFRAVTDFQGRGGFQGGRPQTPVPAVQQPGQQSQRGFSGRLGGNNGQVNGGQFNGAQRGGDYRGGTFRGDDRRGGNRGYNNGNNGGYQNNTNRN